MKVYRYDNLEELNSKLSDLKRNGIRIFAVKIFSTFTGQDKETLKERFYIISQEED